MTISCYFTNNILFNKSMTIKGEVVELVDINGVLHRRCRYEDDDVEDYIITQMKKHCKPR